MSKKLDLHDPFGLDDDIINRPPAPPRPAKEPKEKGNEVMKETSNEGMNEDGNEALKLPMLEQLKKDYNKQRLARLNMECYMYLMKGVKEALKKHNDLVDKGLADGSILSIREYVQQAIEEKLMRELD